MHSRTTSLIGAFTIVLLAVAAAVGAQPPVVLSGHVVANETSQPIADARVSLEGTTFVRMSDADGAFSFGDVPRGTYMLSVARVGFETVQVRIDVDGSSRPLEVRLPVQVDLREEVSVIGRTVGELGLGGRSTTASRLGVRVLDIPASIDVLDSTVMDARGYQKVSDAVSSMTGVVAGEHATAPSSFVIRGFTTNQVSNLRDGIWLGPSAMVMRPQNTFNLERVELLRGPSSVINGQGAVAGTINSVTKTAEPTAAATGQALLSYGRYNTYHAAAGATGPVGEAVWYRADISRSGSDGFVQHMDSGSSNVTGSLLWRPTLPARVKFSADYLDDDLAKYFGTPLVPADAAIEPLDVIRATTGEVVDGRMRFVNYNVSDGFAESQQLLLRSDVGWDLTERVTLNNVLYHFNADRRWRNSEGYVYCSAIVDVCTEVGQIQRYYGYFLINHDQHLLGNRLTLNVDAPVAKREHLAVFGLEASTLDFERTRGFRIGVPLAPGDAVDPVSPVPGVYGLEEVRGISPTDITAWSLFAEDSLALTGRLRLAGGLRFDGLDLERQNVDANRNVIAGGFTRTYNWWSWRAGALYTIVPGVVTYGQYSTAKDPVSANVFLVNANQNFDLTEATQWEAGLKADVNRGRTQLTLAYFDISRDDVLERFALDSATNIGGITSRGVELAGTFRVGDPVRLGANLGFTDSSYRPSANFVRFAGNRPPNVPRVTANAWASYEDIAGLPIEIGGSARFVGDRFANNANTITMEGYALADVYAAWTRDRLRVTARVDNVTDTIYASWSDVFYLGQNDPSFLYANQLMLGAPRTFSVMLQLAF